MVSGVRWRGIVAPTVDNVMGDIADTIPPGSVAACRGPSKVRCADVIVALWQPTTRGGWLLRAAGAVEAQRLGFRVDRCASPSEAAGVGHVRLRPSRWYRASGWTMSTASAALAPGGRTR